LEPFAPLAERLRPRNLDEYIGQEHILGKNKPLRRTLESGIVPSMILWGPPGVGKTTLALMMAEITKRQFHSLSAISAGVKDLREVLSKPSGLFPPILFIDEIHRFNKSQQDSLLGAVEKGHVTLIGATTENPSFEVNSALLSRCQVYVLEAFGKKELELLLKRALKSDAWLKDKNIKVDTSDSLFRMSGGDGRKLLNLLELVVNAQVGQPEVVISNELVEEVVQKIANCHLLGHFTKVKCFLSGDRYGHRFGRENFSFARSGRFTKCPNEAHERDWIWKKLSVFTQL
jgi:putative ATPase